MARTRIASIAAAASAAALMTVAGATSAYAEGIGVPGGGQPVMVDLHNDPMIFPAGTVCPFQVTVADVDTNATGKVYDNGTIKGTGRLFTSITNDLTGESVVRNISGPGQIYTDSAGLIHFILNGASLNWVTEGMDATGTVDVGLYIRHGSVVYDGFTLVSYTGTAENLCETLAD
jgi:Tol biopolymer transport system component